MIPYQWWFNSTYLFSTPVLNDWNLMFQIVVQRIEYQGECWTIPVANFDDKVRAYSRSLNFLKYSKMRHRVKRQLVSSSVKTLDYSRTHSHTCLHFWKFFSDNLEFNWKIHIIFDVKKFGNDSIDFASFNMINGLLDVFTTVKSADSMQYINTN